MDTRRPDQGLGPNDTEPPRVVEQQKSAWAVLADEHRRREQGAA